MQIKTNWTSNDYLDVYVLDDGTVIDVLNADHTAVVNDNDNHAINRIRRNCRDSCTMLNDIYGSNLSFSNYSHDSINGILDDTDMTKIETIIKTLCDATGQEFEVKTWGYGTPVYASDFNRFEKPFLLLNKYETVYSSHSSDLQTAFRVRRCGNFNCGDSTARYGG